MIIANPIGFAFLPLISRNFFNNIQDGFHLKSFEMVNPTIFVCCLVFAISDVHPQAALGIIRLSNIPNFVGKRIAEGVDIRGFGVEVAFRIARWYSVLHSKGRSLLSRLWTVPPVAGAKHLFLPLHCTTNPLYKQHHTLFTCRIVALRKRVV